MVHVTVFINFAEAIIVRKTFRALCRTPC